MKLLEIKNNLVKLSYEGSENPILGRFVILASGGKSYVAQFVNLKSDNVNNFAIAKLLFTFTPDGVVDNYDGSVPSTDSELSFLPSDELLSLLPLETPIKLGNLSQQESMLNIDISVFERNFTVFVEKDSNKTTFISNCVRQLFQMKEKSIIIDNDNLFEDYPKIEVCNDFKLPLNSEMIEYLLDYELSEIDAPTKAVIQDIFYAVQQYIDSLEFKFLPIDNFVDVVANQYKETQMPELALLKNKLLKYKDANVFANTKEEVLAFNELLSQKNCSIVDIKNIHESLQKEVISFIHKQLESLDKYTYLFVPLTDENSDKKLIKQLINNNHVFTTLLASHSYKYVSELKSHAENIILFAPQTLQHDFAIYNTFLNKLNLDECIVYGKLTQGIPFIIDMSDLDLDLTKEDVLGDKYQFVAIQEDRKLVDENGIEYTDNLGMGQDEIVDAPQNEESEADEISSIPEIEQPEQDIATTALIEEDDQSLMGEESRENNSEDDHELTTVEEEAVQSEIVEESDMTEELSAEDFAQEPQISEPVDTLIENDEIVEDTSVEDSNLRNSDAQDDLNMENSIEQTQELTEDDLNFIEGAKPLQSEDLIEEDNLEGSQDVEIEEGADYVESPYVNDQSPVVPVYPADNVASEPESDEMQYAQGDSVSHPRYGRGVIEKIIKYGNKTLCSISFENVGRRLLDPSISEFVKL